MLISFLQQATIWIFASTQLTCVFQIHSYKGYFDDNLEWVGVEGIQIVGTLSGGTSTGLSPRFMSLVAVLAMRWEL
jgi:hypothetical protein